MNIVNGLYERITDKEVKEYEHFRNVSKTFGRF